MSAARLAAEAAFTDPDISAERRPAAPVTVEVRQRRLVMAPAGQDQPADPDNLQTLPGDRSPRVFRMEPALRQAMGLPAADDGERPAAGSNAAQSPMTRRKRQLAPPVHIVHAAAAATDERLPAVASTDVSGPWAEIAQALARLDATCAAIRAAQDFNHFADVHLPAGAAASQR